MSSPRYLPETDAETMDASTTEVVNAPPASPTCECGDGCNEQVIDENTSGLVAAPANAACAGILAYGHLELANESHLVAMVQNYGSSRTLFRKGEQCYPGRVVRATHYNGGRQIVCAPCKICRTRDGIQC